MLPRILLSVLLLLAAPAQAVTIAVGSETYLVETFPLPAVSDGSPVPLDITVDAQTGATIYMCAEFDRRLYSVARAAAASTTMTAEIIPAPGSPIFRSNTGGTDTGSQLSFQQEKIASTSDGSVWVSQGGNYFYNGTNNNWSRIMRRKPTGSWDAFTLPFDAAGAVGFKISDPPNQLWVNTFGENSLFTTRLRGWHEGENSPTRYPPVDNRWTKLREFGAGPAGSFPAQLIQLKDGRIAGTLYFTSSFFIFDRNTVRFTDVALATPPAGTTAGSSGPWQIIQDTNENLWFAEDYAQRVTKYNIFTGVQTVYDLSASLSADEHPHSLALDAAGTGVFVTTYPISVGGDGRLVSITSAGTISIGASFATISLAGGLTGIVRTTSTEIWVALYRQSKVARLTKQ